MDFNEIKELIKLVNESDLAYFEVKNNEDYVKMDKSLNRNLESKKEYSVDVDNNKQSLNNNINNNDEKSEKVEKIISDNLTENEESDFEYIVSPMVGTFYKAISPESEPFVNVGQKVKKGEVLCIVEAMKLMNEIVADFDCEIVSIECENEKMVEYGETLFKVRK